MVVSIKNVKNNYIYFEATYKDKKIKDVLLKVGD